MKRLAHVWDDFCKAVMPPNASTVQRWEMRRAFYAGAQAMLTSVKALGEQSVHEDVREGRA